MLLALLVVPALALANAARGEAGAPSAAAAGNDLYAIRAAVFDYFEGINEASLERLQRAFHPGAFLKSPAADGSLKIEPIAHAIERWVSAEPHPREGYIRSLEIVEGRLARVVFDFNGRYIDFLTLVKLQGRWKIIDKAFVAL
jgi:hypothetical protein